MCDFNENDYVYQSFWFKNEIKEWIKFEELEGLVGFEVEEICN